MNILRVYLALKPLQLHHVKQYGLAGLRSNNKTDAWLFLKKSRDYATLIAEQWYAPRHGAGYVIGVSFDEEFLSGFEQYSIAYEEHQEIKIAMTELDTLQDNLCGELKVESVCWMKNMQRNEIISFA